MKTTAQAIADSGLDSRVVRAVVRRIGRESIEDVNRHGIAGGFSGFIYYSDTVNFWRKYKAEIITMLEDLCSDLGEGLLETVFNWLDGDWSTTEIGAAIYGKYSADFDVIYNALAWFAAEEVCRAFED